MRIIQKIYSGVGLISEWTGKVARWLIVIIIVAITYDVLMRYAFNAPTNWSWCLSYMLGASFLALGFAYNWYHNANVRIDIIYSRFSPKAKLIIDVFFTLLFFFPVFFFVTEIFIKDALFAYSIQQRDVMSVWYPITWPYKTVVAVGFCLLFLQGIATFLKDVMALVKGGKEPW